MIPVMYERQTSLSVEKKVKDDPEYPDIFLLCSFRFVVFFVFVWFYVFMEVSFLSGSLCCVSQICRITGYGSVPGKCKGMNVKG